MSSWLAVATLLLAGGDGTALEDVPTPSVAVGALDEPHQEFASVLAAVVTDDGVDYALLRHEHSALDRYRAQLAAAVVPTTRDAKLSFFINAYNAETLALVVDKLPADQTRWPTWSIKDAGSLLSSVWNSYSFVVAGQRYTLDALENKVLRPLGEPRIHLAINCASRSCPALGREPFRSETLNAQLEAASRAFIANPNQLRLEHDVLYVNPILDWFSADFNASGGVRTFLLARVADGPLATALRTEHPLHFFDYDWTLNLTRKRR